MGQPKMGKLWQSTTFLIEPVTYEAMRKAAFKRKESLGSFLRAALDEYLKQVAPGKKVVPQR